MPYLEAVLVGGWQDEGWGVGKGDHAYGWLEGVSEHGHVGLQMNSDFKHYAGLTLYSFPP